MRTRTPFLLVTAATALSAVVAGCGSHDHGSRIGIGYFQSTAIGPEVLVAGMTATRAVFPAGREQELLVLVVKLLVHVAAPALLLAALGAKIAPLFSSGIGRPGFWPPLLVLGAIILALLCVVSPALDEIKALHATVATLAWTAPAAFIWLAIEAGLFVARRD